MSKASSDRELFWLFKETKIKCSKKFKYESGGLMIERHFVIKWYGRTLN